MPGWADTAGVVLIVGGAVAWLVRRAMRRMPHAVRTGAAGGDDCGCDCGCK
jgi:hypothetical protein